MKRQHQNKKPKKTNKTKIKKEIASGNKIMKDFVNSIQYQGKIKCWRKTKETSIDNDD